MSAPISSGPCCTCKTDFWLPRELYDAARRSNNITFYCPYGHPQVFRQGDSEADILRRERDRALQKIAERDDALRQKDQELATANQRADEFFGKAKKLRNRAKAGLCPCCHRTFRQMALHMKSQHPEFKAEAVQ